MLRFVPKPAGTLASGAKSLLRGVNELRDRRTCLRIRPRQRRGDGELHLADLGTKQCRDEEARVHRGSFAGADAGARHLAWRA